jgi:predicted Fe-Mo cluster-binding NifX family protein
VKIAVATMKGGLEDNVSPVMGRCSTFTIVEVEDGKINKAEVIDNTFGNSAGGAGIQSAQLLVEQGVEAVIAGNFGPNAFGVLEQAKIKLVQAQGNVEDAIMRYVRGELKPLDSGSAAPRGLGDSGAGGLGRGGGRGGI